MHTNHNHNLLAISTWCFPEARFVYFTVTQSAISDCLCLLDGVIKTEFADVADLFLTITEGEGRICCSCCSRHQALPLLSRHQALPLLSWLRLWFILAALKQIL